MECWLQASTVAAGVNAYLIKTDVAKLDATEMARYVEDRIGNTITTAWNLNVKDVEMTISGVCQRVSCLLCGVLQCQSVHSCSGAFMLGNFWHLYIVFVLD